MKLISTNMMIALVVALALFMEALDTTIINTAIPAMAQSLHVNPVNLKIALISYLLSLAIFIPVSSWVADRFGIKRVFIVALGIFTVSSFFCGYSSNLFQLVLARSLQGLGGAFMLPVGRLVLVRTFSRHELAEVMNVVIMVMSIGLMLGPLAGGMITYHVSWHWIFWVNIPVGLLAMVMAMVWFEATPPVYGRTFDTIGFLLFGIGLSALIFSLSELSDTTANLERTGWIFIVAISLLISYFFYARKQVQPIVNLQILRFRTYRISILGNLFARLGFGGAPFLLPLLMQVGLGYTPQLSGMLMTPVALGVIFVKPLSLRILRQFGFRRVLLINTLLIGIMLWLLCVIQAGVSIYIIGSLTFLFGFLVAMQFTGMNSMAYADLPHEEQGAATSLFSTVQQLAQSLAVAVSALLLRYFSARQDAPLTLTVSVFHHVFIALGMMTIISILVFLPLRTNDGHQMLSPPVKN